MAIQRNIPNPAFKEIEKIEASSKIVSSLQDPSKAINRTRSEEQDFEKL